MAKLIFVNLPVADLPKATAFYEAVGATKNPMFSDATTSCMVFSETINVMLLTHEKFSQFTSKPIADAKDVNQVLLCMSVESRAEVDALVGKVEAAGGRADPSPGHDHGFMYGRSFEDPDGHLCQLMWMDMAAAKTAMAQQANA